jgi:tetratricopeptide (TPR) repeat protein
MSARLQQLMKFHEAEPGDAFCTYGIALEHAKAGRTDQSLEWLDKTLENDRNYAYAHYQKAKLLAEVGRVAEAKNVAQQGIEAAQRGGDGHAAGELSALIDSF